MSLEHTLKKYLHDIWVAIDFLSGTLENLCINEKTCKLDYIKDINFRNVIKKVKSKPCDGRRYLLCI